jgi:phosphoglycolate phosphatase-like HAD superfamily hydrolase
VSIHGSPIPKDNLVAAIIRNNAYEPFETILVGDSINDYEAAVRNDIRFCGFNNPGLKDIGTAYINESMEELKFLIYELPEV